MKRRPEFSEVREAARRIAGHVCRTPVIASDYLDEQVRGQVFFKCENLQVIGAFKARGAHNAVFCLAGDRASNGVATHSSGNHGAALALAARSRGIPAHVVMPENASRIKRDAVEHYGASITYCGPTLRDRETTLAAVVGERGVAVVHPYNDPDVIAGQGTAALELLQEITDLDLILVPVGGGGLLSGTLIATRGLSGSTRVLGVEPRQADDAYRSLVGGERVMIDAPDTIADGLRACLGDLTFDIIRDLVDGIVCVEETEIVSAMRYIWQRLKLVVEPSSAVPLAAVLAGKVSVEGKRVGIILTGGNVDLDDLPWIARGATVGSNAGVPG